MATTETQDVTETQAANDSPPRVGAACDCGCSCCSPASGPADACGCGCGS